MDPVAAPAPEFPASEFKVPAELDLPAELTGPPPRPLPREVFHSRLAQQRNNMFWGLMAAAFICCLMSFMPFIDTLALYVLPLGYLLWISVALILIAVVGRLGGEWKKSRDYIKHGHAAFARVDTLTKNPVAIVNGQAVHYALVAGISMPHPETGQVVSHEVKSRPFSADKKDKIDTYFRIGDYVPVIWMPKKFLKTMQIYDFLEVMPDACLVRDTTKTTPLWQAIAAPLVIVGLFFALFWNIYAIGRYEPIQFDWLRQGGIPMAAGGLVGLAAVCTWWLLARKNGQKVAERNADAAQAGAAVEVPAKANILSRVFLGLLVVPGAALLCGMTVLCWCMTANAMFDRSPGKERPVVISNMVQVTHNFVFREYKMEYQFQEDPKKRSLLTTPQHLMQFQFPVGIAQIREGWLGWPWVETIEPAVAINQLFENNIPAADNTPADNQKPAGVDK